MLVLKTGIEGIFLGNDARGEFSSHEEGCKGMLFVMGKYIEFTVEVLQDQGTGSIGIVTKCCATDAP